MTATVAWEPDLSLRARRVRESLRDHGLLHVALSIVNTENGDMETVFSRDRRPRAVRIRHRIWAVLHWSAGISLPTLGAIFRVDHTTILNGVRRHEHRLNAPDMPFKAYLSDVIRHEAA